MRFYWPHYSLGRRRRDLRHWRMANFGIAEQLVVITQSARNGERTRCRAQRSTLSVTESCIDFEELLTQGNPGTPGRGGGGESAVTVGAAGVGNGLPDGS